MTDINTSTIELTADDGVRISAYSARPTGPVRGGLVVVQEIFGVNGHIRSVADGYARRGYAVIAPALFDRLEPGIELAYDQTGIERGRGLAMKLGFDNALRDVTAAAQQLRADGKVGVVGYCWGGTVAFLAAARVDAVSAAVGYYGGAIAKVAGEAPRAPLMLHFGEQDKGIPLSDVAQIRAQRPEAEVHLYPAQHGFNCDARGSYDAASAELALTRTLAFFEKHVG